MLIGKGKGKREVAEEKDSSEVKLKGESCGESESIDIGMGERRKWCFKAFLFGDDVDLKLVWEGSFLSEGGGWLYIPRGFDLVRTYTMSVSCGGI